MSTHVNKKFSESEVADIFERYLNGEINAKAAQGILSLKKTRFFELIKIYREDPKNFCLVKKRNKPGRSLTQETETKIIQCLKDDKKLILDKNNPIHRYNYSYIKTQLKEDHDIDISLSTIIRRAKKMNFIKRSAQKNVMIEKC